MEVVYKCVILLTEKRKKMGMYTELIFGAELNSDTPDSVIDVLKYMTTADQPKGFTMPEELNDCECLFFGTSYYFGVNECLFKMWYDDISRSWHISTRSNIKNYKNQIERFLEWIKPHIDSGSGCNDMYAIVTYEESGPIIYNKVEE